MTQTNTFGQSLNSIQGGIYVLDWEKETKIRVWFFPRNNIPTDILNDTPNPESWGKPSVLFPFGNHCSPDHFQDLKITINLTFCGDW